jgi:hypothetical protein
MITLINLVILACLFLVITKFILSTDSYQKIIGFYFAFSKLIILILFNSISKFEHIADIILLLFLVELAAVLFLLLNQKNSEIEK